jgi:hypothetical protein
LQWLGRFRVRVSYATSYHTTSHHITSHTHTHTSQTPQHQELSLILPLPVATPHTQHHSINTFIQENVYMATYRKISSITSAAASSSAAAASETQISAELKAEVAEDNEKFQLYLRLREIGAKVVELKVVSNVQAFDSPTLTQFTSTGKDSKKTPKDSADNSSSSEDSSISLCVLRSTTLADTKQRLYSELREKLGESSDAALFPIENCRLRRFNPVSK